MRAGGVAILLAAVLAAVPGDLAAAAADAAEDWLLHCSACHRADGSGVGEFPSLRDLGALLHTPAGRAYVVRVPGVAQAPLSDARLARLLNWTFATFSGADAGYEAAEVGALRAEPLRDPRAARAALDAGAAPPR